MLCHVTQLKKKRERQKVEQVIIFRANFKIQIATP
jgi:hypothetical protein